VLQRVSGALQQPKQRFRPHTPPGSSRSRSDGVSNAALGAANKAARDELSSEPQLGAPGEHRPHRPGGRLPRSKCSGTLGARPPHGSKQRDEQRPCAPLPERCLPSVLHAATSNSAGAVHSTMSVKWRCVSLTTGVKLQGLVSFNSLVGLPLGFLGLQRPRLSEAVSSYTQSLLHASQLS
jgi:hypothetical protein